MLFLTPTEIRKKRKLFQQSQRGTLTPEQVFRRAIAIDPFDCAALLGLGVECERKTDREDARRYFWQALDADPGDCQPYLHLTASYAESDPELAGSLSYLALLRVLQSPRIEPAAEQWLAATRADIERSMPGMDEDKLYKLAPELAQSRFDEPERVTTLLLPYRLIQEVIDRPCQGMRRDAVDRIHEHGAACVSLLIGVLRGYARCNDDEGGPAASALVLLGEIGDKSALPAVRECLDVDEPVVAAAAAWAAGKIEERQLTGRTVYDICCEPLPSQPPHDDPIARETRISGMLLDFMKDNIKPGEMQDALKMFFGHAPAAELEGNDQIGFFDWLLNDYRPRHFRRSIPQEYLARHGEQLAKTDRKALQEWTGSYSSLFEVQSVKKGAGVDLRDLLLDRSLFVHDVAASGDLARWDCVFTRVRPQEDRTVFTSGGVRITPGVSGELRDWIEADRRQSGLDWLPYLRANSHRIRQHCADIYDQERRNMRIVTAEGDDIVFSKAAYRVLDRGRVLAALEGAELIGDRHEENGVVSFTWFETAALTDQGRRALGSLRLEDDRLLLECTSRQRLKRGMALIHKLAGQALEEKLTEFQSAQAAMRNMPKSSAERHVPSEEEKLLISRLKEQHYRTWPDQRLPALGGRTPREASRDSEGRRLLIALLKTIENSEERKRIEGGAWFDIANLKSELDVDF